jgi:hypothetical protein
LGADPSKKKELKKHIKLAEAALARLSGIQAEGKQHLRFVGNGDYKRTEFVRLQSNTSNH